MSEAQAQNNEANAPAVQANQVDGLSRAATLLLLLNENEAAEILKHFEGEEIHQVADAMSSLGQVSNEQVARVAARFCEDAGQESLLAGDGEAKTHIRNLLVLALGNDRARDVIAGVRHLDRRGKGVDALGRRDPNQVADMLRAEHPQVVATLLAQIDPDHAGKIMALFEEDRQRDVLLRMATLESLPQSALAELNALVEGHLTSDDDTSGASLGGGPRTVAGVLNALDSATQSAMLESVKELDPDLGEQVELNMFTFDDLLKIDDRAIQTLLAEIPGQTLGTALKGAEDSTKQKFFSNMSARAAEMLADDIEVSGPVKLSEVEAAQREIVSTARRLMDAGTIVVGGVAGAEELVY